MKTLSKHDTAWQRVFEQSNLLQQIQIQGYVYISAEQLKTTGRREPRLLAKQDTLNARPAIFKEHNLTIFPVENGQYVIFQDSEQKSYFRFDASLDELQPQQYASKLDLNTFETYPVNQHLSESQAIDFAFVSSLLQYFLGDDRIYLTIRGRFSSSFRRRRSSIVATREVPLPPFFAVGDPQPLRGNQGDEGNNCRFYNT